MRKLVSLFLVLLWPASAMAQPPERTAERPAVEAPGPVNNTARTKPTCEPLPNAAAIRQADSETTDPDGNPIPQLCPHGQQLVVHGDAPDKHGRAHTKGAAFGTRRLTIKDTDLHHP